MTVDMATLLAIEAPREAGAVMGTVGTSGLRRFGGWVREEFLPALQGERGRGVFREMADNDPVVGAMLQAIDLELRKVAWTVKPVDDSPQAVEVRDFVDGCLGDMTDTWPDTLSSIASMLTFGFSWHEVIYKYRKGDRPGVDEVTGLSLPTSAFDDGKLGWANLPTRAQESLLVWDYVGDQLVGYIQLDPASGATYTVPLAKSLHFRTTAVKSNPEGRALDPATPIATPDGWTTMGDLAVGSKVFDEQGRIRYVTAVADWENRPRYAITFSSGETIIADGAHQWPTTLIHERTHRQPARLRTTEGIAATVQNSNGVSNHAVAWAAPLDMHRQHLAVDPYVFGLWLGDGTTLSAGIACHADDEAATVALIEQAGYPCKTLPNGTSALGRQIKVYGGLQTALRGLGVIGDKHVPEQYLRGSYEQRLALLAGLMDSDGTVNADGACEFTNVNMELIDAVAELVRSLGIGPKVTLRRRARGTWQEAWAVKFTPDFVPFRLERKVARCKLARGRRHHYIVAVERIEDGPTRCIEVDSPSHLFLAGRTLVATHNSILRNAYRPWYYKRRIEEIEAIGVERDLAGLPIAGVPPEYLQAGATEDQKALVASVRKMLTSIRRNESEGILMPLDYGTNGKERFKLELLSAPGQRQFDTDKIIGRYDQRIALTALADFLLIGQEGATGLGGSGLTVSKTELFQASIETWLDMIGAEFNTRAVPTLVRLNGWDPKLAPTLVHGSVNEPTTAELGTFLQQVCAAGAAIFPNPELENWLLARAGMPTSDAEEL